MLKKFDDPRLERAWEYLLITAGILVMSIGIHFFKFPNHFAFGGVTGLSSVISAVAPLSSSDFTTIANMVLLVVGFIFIGRGFGIRTVYASVLMSALLELFDIWFPLEGTLTGEPLLELVYAMVLPALGSAVLFEVGASSGGTDIIAMILKKHTSINIGTALIAVDIFSVGASFFLFTPATGLYSLLGLLVKSLLLDSVIESLRLCKCFTIVCSDPQPICDYIIHTLDRGATVYEARGAYSSLRKTVILTTMNRRQAIRLRAFIRQHEPDAFMMITNSSEIIGKGFQTV